MESNTAQNSLDRHDIKANLSDASSKIKGGVVDLVEESKYVASMCQELMSKSIHDGIEVVNHKSGQIISAIGQTVKEKPMQSMVVAAGLGLVLGAVLRRSRS